MVNAVIQFSPVKATPGTQWQCTENCGACCRALKEKAKTWWVWIWLRILDRGDGTCRFLNEDNNKCRIYNNRPNVCIIKKWKYTKEQIEAACDILIEKYRRVV